MLRIQNMNIEILTDHNGANANQQYEVMIIERD